MEYHYSKFALPEASPFPKDEDGTLALTQGQGEFLALIGQIWHTHPDYEDHTLDCYLTQVLRALYLVPDHILNLVAEELLSDDERCLKPTVRELQKLCSTAIRIKPYLQRRLGMDVR